MSSISGFGKQRVDQTCSTLSCNNRLIIGTEFFVVHNGHLYVAQQNTPDQ